MPRKDDVEVSRSTELEPFGATEGEVELSPKRSDDRPAQRMHLERGWVKHRLIRDIALGEKTGKDLSRIYGVSENSITNFKKRHGLEIEEVRNNLADQYAGVWVAQKLARIQEYQQAAEKMAKGDSPRNAEVLTTILKAVAEELGDLPARQQVNVSTENVTHIVVGIDPGDLT